MWQRIRGYVSQPRWWITTNARGRRPRAHQPFPEVLEDRQLLTASLQPIPNLTVPAQLGYQLVLDGSGNTDPGQTYTVSSSNPDVQVSVAQGQYWTITVSHTPANSTDVSINHESMTFQLFGDLTPQTIARIATLTNGNYYTTATLPNSSPAGPGKYFPRITSVSNAGFSVLQGGSGSATSTSSSSGITPIATEPVQQLAFTGQYQIAMANTGAPDSTDAQFFITNGVLSQSAQRAFDFNYTIFGQL
ncbi:MAG: peptidylprolyl isomerase, partial [Isosphaeraceae bacterium]